MGRIVLWFATALLLLGLGAVFVSEVGPLLYLQRPDDGASGEREEESLREYFSHHGLSESGAINLVSAIYLGYRAFDTLGETIVLVLSVAAVILISGVK
jgi:multisubunit Na+/H+ antiporter MnhB subunit